MTAATEDTDPTPEPGFARSTALMAGGTLLSRLTGFARLAAFTAAIGATEGRLADAYATANVVPNLVYELVLGGVLSSMLVPVFVESLRRGEDEHRRVVDAITTLAGLVLVGITAVGVLAAPFVARLLLAGDDPREAEVVARLLQLFLPQVLGYGMATVWTAYLNAHRRFGVPMVAPVLNNLVAVVVLLAFGAAVRFTAIDLALLTSAQLWLLGAGTTAGVLAMVLPMWPAARRVGWRYRPRLDLQHELVRRVGRLGGWAALYVLVNQLGYLVVVLLANAVPGAGTYTAYTLAFVFFQLPHGIYAVSVMTALVPRLSEHAAAGDLDAFRAQLARGIRATMLVIAPAAVGLAVLATPLVRLLLEQGVFGAESTRLVARVLAVWMLGLPAFSLFQLLLRAHYALQDTRTPALVNIGAVTVNVVIDIAAFAFLPAEWKVAGLAIGHAASYWVGCALFLRLLCTRIGGVGGRATSGALARIAAAATATGAVAAAVLRAGVALLGAEGLLAQALTVGAAVSLGAAAHIVVARAVGVEEVAVLTRTLRRVAGRLPPP